MTKAEKFDRPRPNPGILEIKPLILPKHAPDGREMHQLSTNTNPFGASPAAVEAMQKLDHKIEMLPESGASRLRATLAAAHGINADNIVCTNGSGEAISLLAKAYLGPEDEGVVTENSFMVYRTYIQAAGANPVIADEVAETASVDTMLAALSDRTKVVFLANPNNPTGTYVPANEVKRLHGALPKNVLLVLDAAYAEYVRRVDYDAGARLVEQSENVVMLRTFSKAHGLGGARLGWVYCPEHVADVLNRVRTPFNVTAAAIEAGIAAIGDREHVARTIEHNEHWLPWLTEELTRLGLRVTPSVSNFILVHFPADGRHTAAAADEFLWSRGILVRWVVDYGLRNALRMTVGAPGANRKVVAALREFLGS